MIPRKTVKICGVTSVDQALSVVDAGAGAVGFNVWPKSVRSVDWDMAARMMEKIRGSALGVVVMVDPTLEEALRLWEHVRPDQIQLHGDETPETVQALADRIGGCCYKAVGLAGAEDVSKALRVPGEVVLVDAKDVLHKGGTGTQAPLECVLQVVKARPTLVAGGLGVHNVASVVHACAPWGVDAASLVESSPGQKDIRLVQDFVRNALRAFDEV
jgi:phosphoribosylanthranilate isomerase